MMPETKDYGVPSKVEEAGPHGDGADLCLDARERRVYDKMRSKVAEAVRGKAPPGLQKAAELLFALPDLIVLIFRLLRDRRVPLRAKVKLAVFAAYFASPIDLVPDVIPVVGRMDDLIGAALVLRDLLTVTPKEVVHSHWSGNEDVIELIQTVLEVAPEILNRRIVGGLLMRFRKRG